MEPFFATLFAVAVAEMGDRTQILALMLACTYRKPLAIMAGIVAATLVNHLAAGAVGILLAQYLTPRILDTAVAIGLIGMAGWVLIPDKPGKDPDISNRGAFLATLVLFFFTEMGDKTQIATAALAAAYRNLFLVVAGSTLGLLIADLPAVFLGNAFASRIPLKTVRLIAAITFGVLGIVFAVRALGA